MCWRAQRDLVTFKCAGCGVRLPATARYLHPALGAGSGWTVCSPACLETAGEVWKRQLGDARLKALLQSEEA